MNAGYILAIYFLALSLRYEKDVGTMRACFTAFAMGVAILFLAAPLAFAGPGGPPPQLPPCMPVNLAQMSWQAKSEESLRVIPVYMPINIFKAWAELKPKAVVAVKATKKKALRKEVARTKGCKPGRTKNKRGQCGRWK